MNSLIQTNELIYYFKDTIDSHNSWYNNTFTAPVSGTYVYQRNGKNNFYRASLIAGDRLWDICCKNWKII